MKKQLAKSLALLAAALVAVQLACAADVPLAEAGGPLQSLPPTSGDAKAQQPYHDALKNKDGKLENYYKIPYVGYFDLPMVLNKKDSNTRLPASVDAAERAYDLRMYLPENSRYSQASVLLVVPSGADPYKFMVDSGWKAAADKEKISMFLLMPNRVKNSAGQATAWGSWSSAPYAELKTYISGAVDVIGQRPGIQTVNYCQYVIGYGDAADLVVQYLMESPRVFAGAFAVGSTGKTADIAKLKAAPSRVPGVMISEVAVPFGVVSDKGADVSALVGYFKAANHTVEKAAVKKGFTYFAPDAKAKVGQPDSEPVAGVYTLQKPVASCLNAEFASTVFGFLKEVRMYPGYGNNELRAYEDVKTSKNYQYYTSLSALGRYTYGGDIAKSGDGEYYNREWWLYVPESAKKKMAAGKKVETIFLFMGSNGYGDEIAQRTGWDKVADKNGFILVCPSGHVRHMGNFGNFTRNGVNVYQYCTNWTFLPNEYNATSILPNDLLLIEDIHGWLFGKKSPYAGNLDIRRVYASGQSAGGGFTNQVVARLPKLFAAAAPSSFTTTFEGADESSDVGMVVMVGQKDTTVPGGLKTGWNNASPIEFDYLVKRFGSPKDAQGRSAWKDFTFMQEAANGEKSVCTETEGNFNKYILKTPKGVPMFVATEVLGLTHATIPSQCEFAWSFMKGFSKDTDGTLYYNGMTVDTPINKNILSRNNKD